MNNIENWDNEPISFDLSDEDLKAIKGGATISDIPSDIKHGFPIRITAIRIHPFPIRISPQPIDIYPFPIKIHAIIIKAPPPIDPHEVSI
jgi:hypothetical protein